MNAVSITLSKSVAKPVIFRPLAISAVISAILLGSFAQFYTMPAHSALFSINQARNLNDRGFRLYKQQKYEEALPLFYRATQVDPYYFYGQYNFACTASIVLGNVACNHPASADSCKRTKGVTDFENEENREVVELAYKGTSALKKAIKLRPKYRKISQTDPDLAVMRKGFHSYIDEDLDGGDDREDRGERVKDYNYYTDILGYSTKNRKQLKTILVNGLWLQDENYYSHNGKPERIIFYKDNRVSVRHSIHNQYSDDWKTFNYKYTKGKYQLNSNGKISLTFNTQHGTKRITAHIDSKGRLNFNGKVLTPIINATHYSPPIITLDWMN